MNVGISAYSFWCACGFLRRGSDDPATPRIDAFALVDLAASWKLASIEIPLPAMLPDMTPATMDRLRRALEDASLALVVDAPVIDVAALQLLLPLAKRAGARIVRAMLSTILEGARATYPGGWDAHLAEMRRRLVELRPLLAAHDLALAIENHQDATSDELLELCEAGGPHVGITLDVANPLAVGEEPLAFARKVGPLVRNVHLKDYRVFATPSGFRLVRCALGEGLIPFPDLLALLAEVAPGAPRHIELAAMYARHIRLLEDDWWEGYPSRDVRAVVPALRFVARSFQPPDEPWESPWERGLPTDEVARYERSQFERSLEYLRLQGVQ